MKKWLCLILSILMVLVTFSACSKSGGSGEGDGESEKESESGANTSSAESVAIAFINAIAEGDSKTEIDLSLLDLEIMEKAFSSEIAEEGITVEEYYRDISDEMFYFYEEGYIDEEPDFDDFDGYIKFTTLIDKTEMKSEFESYYGSDYTVTIELGDEIEISEEDIEFYRETADEMIMECEDEYSFDIDISGADIEEFALYEYSIEIKGSEGEELSEGNEIILCKINGEWKVLDCER